MKKTFAFCETAGLPAQRRKCGSALGSDALAASVRKMRDELGHNIGINIVHAVGSLVEKILFKNVHTHTHTQNRDSNAIFKTHPICKVILEDVFYS